MPQPAPKPSPTPKPKAPRQTPAQAHSRIRRILDRPDIEPPADPTTLAVVPPPLDPPSASAIAAFDPSAHSAARRKIMGIHLRFINQFAAQGFVDPERAARSAGFTRSGMGYKLASRFADLIEKERVRIGLRQQMSLDEAMKLVGEGARSLDDDPKTRLAYLRTVIEVHGGLDRRAPSLPPGSLDAAKRQTDSVLLRIGEKIAKGQFGKGAQVRIRELLRERSVERTVEIADSAEDAGSGPSEDAQAGVGEKEIKRREGENT